MGAGSAMNVKAGDRPKSSELARLFTDFTLRVTAMRLFAEQIGPIADERDEGFREKIVQDLNDILGVDVLAPVGSEKRSDLKIAVTPVTAGPADETHSEFIPIAKKVDLDRLYKFATALRRSQSEHGPILRRSALIMAVTQLDALVADLLRAFYGRFPEALDGEEHKLSFKDLCELGSLDIAREVVLARRIDAVLHSSSRDQLSFFSKRLKVDLSHLEPYLDILDETVQRRHIWVHNGGRVSKLYLSRVAPSLIQKFSAVEGEVLPVDSTYLRRAIDRVNLAGVVLGQQCWRKWAPEESAAANDALNENIFDTISDGRYTAAQYLGEYGRGVCKSPDSVRRNTVLNLAQAYKWAGKPDRALQVVVAEDWTSCSLRFQLAVAVIKDDFETAVRLLPLALKSGDVSTPLIETWPIFREFRKDARVIAAMDVIRRTKQVTDVKTA